MGSFKFVTQAPKQEGKWLKLKHTEKSCNLKDIPDLRFKGEGHGRGSGIGRERRREAGRWKANEPFRLTVPIDEV